jgi:acrylyl-CoA reductase (NADPH)
VWLWLWLCKGRIDQMFRALILEQDAGGLATPHLRTITTKDLPAGDVTVAVEYSTINYKDGLAMLPNGGGIVRSYPHVGGVDFAGTVTASDDPRYAPGDAVVSTGWRVGEIHWGGFAQMARVKADWLVPVPKGLTTRQTMAVGTAGLTSALAIMALEDHGLTPAMGEVLVTGAAGGVGSIAVAMLANLGYTVAAVTGRPETADYLRGLGAARIMARADLAETVKRPLETEIWAGGAVLPASVIPFLLRGINLLGIESVMRPYAVRIRAWDRIATNLPLDKLEAMIHPATLADVPALGAAIIKGGVQGRVVVDVNA